MLTDEVGRNFIYVLVSFNRHHLNAIKINGMIAAFADKLKPVLLKVTD